MERTDIEEPSAHSSSDRAATVVLDRITVHEAAAEPAGVDFQLVAFGGGPSVENGAEDSASNTWRGEVGELGEARGGPVCLPSRCAFPYVGRNAVVFGMVVESPSDHFVVNSGGGILQQGGENRLVDRGLVDVLLLACGVLAVVDLR